MVSLSHPTKKALPTLEAPDPHLEELPAGRGGSAAPAWPSAGWRPTHWPLRAMLFSPRSTVG